MGKIMSTTVQHSADSSNLSTATVNGNNHYRYISSEAISSMEALANGDRPYAKSKNQQLQLKLMTLLQTTIKLEPLLDLFFGQISQLVGIQHCHYEYAEKDIDIQRGNISSHSTHYTLDLQNQYLGDFTVSRKQRFSDRDLAHLEALLSIFIHPLRNAISYHDAIQQALTDALTGLGNRGAMETAIDHQWQMAQRYNQHFCILMLDIDHFKSINDTYGHAVGDKVIKTVASVIKETTRQTDRVYRYGGEEFVVILNKSELVGAAVISERIREAVAALTINNEKSEEAINVTISIGGSCSAHNSHIEDLMQQADKVLYYAKNNGRNQVKLSTK